MERLTIQSPKGYALKLDNSTNEQEARKQLMKQYKVAINRLGDFEDIMQMFKFEDIEELKEFIWRYLILYKGSMQS